MLISIKWLRDFIPSDIAVKELADKLTMAGIEVDEIIEVGSQWDNIVTGEIIDISSHPNADKLSLTKIKSGDRVYSVVCGAPNLVKGSKVPLALEGACLPGGISVRTAKIRGELSEGMLCSETELDLGDDRSGLMVLPSESATGAKLTQILDLSDTILSISLTPNRADCLSIVGIAREISALFQVPLQLPENEIRESGQPVENYAAVEIESPSLCPRYSARFIDNINIASSPLWLRRRLETCGIRSINNVVDVTNYILLEWGQPLHAFDCNTVAVNKIIVRKSKKAEKFITLDESEWELPHDTCMICDAEKPIAIGGIMGGLNSGIQQETKSIILESAFFSPQSIARTSRALKLKTEASQRFEKGVDIKGVVPALNRASALIAELSGGSIAKGFIDIFPNKHYESKKIQISSHKINDTIGINLDNVEIKNILKRLQIQVTDTEDGLFQAVPPSFRHDINEPVDLIEEIARINGYENIPVTLPSAHLSSQSTNNSLSLTSSIRELIVSRGFTEVINYSFYSPDHIKNLGLPEGDPRNNPVEILNPLSPAQSVLRTTIVPSLLSNLADNLNNKNSRIKIFEISNVFFQSPTTTQPKESKRVSGLISGQKYDESWNMPQDQTDFYDIKGVVETILERLKIPASLRLKHDERESFLIHNKMLGLFINDQYAGFIGEVHPDILDKYEIESPTYVFDLDFDLFLAYYSTDTHYKPFFRNPAVFRDLALIVDADITSNKIFETIESFKNELIIGINIFDVYRGGNVPPGKKSIAYRLKFQSSSRTLTDSEVNNIHDKLLHFLHKKLGAELR